MKRQFNNPFTAMAEKYPEEAYHLAVAFDCLHLSWGDLVEWEQLWATLRTLQKLHPSKQSLSGFLSGRFFTQDGSEPEYTWEIEILQALARAFLESREVSR